MKSCSDPGTMLTKSKQELRDLIRYHNRQIKVCDGYIDHYDNEFISIRKLKQEEYNRKGHHRTVVANAVEALRRQEKMIEMCRTPVCIYMRTLKHK